MKPNPINFSPTVRKERQRWIIFSLGAVILVSIALQIARTFTTSIDCLIPSGGSPLPGVLNYLMYERQLLRSVMAAGYIIQNQNRIRTAIPLVWMLIRKATGTISQTVFTCFMDGYKKIETLICTRFIQSLRLINRSPGHHLIIWWRVTSDAVFRGIGDSYFLWRNKVTGTGTALSSLRHPGIVFSI